LPGISDVPRSELRRIDERAEDDSDLAEMLVAAIYDVTHAPDRADWYDVVDDTTGTKYEVKSAHLQVGDAYPAAGRFRLWRAQLRSLIHSRAAGKSGTSWVAFVLFDGDQPIDVRRMHAGTVWDLVGDDWNRSGHAEWNLQHKLPIEEVFPEHG
jgi:hypothetical protein